MTAEGALASFASAQQLRLRALVAERIASEARDYVRERDLPRLIRITPEALADHSRAGTRFVLAVLAVHIRVGQENIRAGRWTASPARLKALRVAKAGEELALANMKERAA